MFGMFVNRQYIAFVIIYRHKARALNKKYIGDSTMYDVSEPRNYLEPVVGETIGECCECYDDILAGDDIWEIQGNWYCERCINRLKKTAGEE